MKFVTWNVNGIRKFAGGKLQKILNELDAEVICIQEAKVPRDALTADIAVVDGFNSYFSFCSSGRKGYSGTATYCKDSCKPVDAHDHLALPEADGALGDKDVDGEGRAVITEFILTKVNPEEPGTSEGTAMKNEIKLAVINVYCVNFVPENEERLAYKMRHHRLLEARADWYISRGYNVVILGDFNVAHLRIDHCEAHLISDFDEQPHRIWMNKFIAEKGYVDCFRAFFPHEEKAYTVWNQKTGARATNYGTRVDYAIADKELFDLKLISSCRHITSQLGSDHCPVMMEISSNWVIQSASRLPSLCCKQMPEFRGVQKSIRAFMTGINAVCPNSRVIAKKKKGPTQSVLSNFFAKKEDELKKDEPYDEFPLSLSQKEALNVAADEDLKKRSSQPTSADRSSMFLAKKKVPLCSGHGEPAVERIARKKGPNFNRRFYSCARPQGFAGDSNARCSFFQWI